MSLDTYLYHEKLAREGKLFDSEKDSMEALASEQWVDNPSKFGANLWSEDSDEAVKDVQRLFQSRGIAIENSAVPLIPENERRIQERLDDAERDNQELKEKLAALSEPTTPVINETQEIEQETEDDALDGI